MPGEFCENFSSVIKKTKEAILEHFRTSVFNTCEHKEIPTIEIGEPLKLHIEKNAKPPDKKVKFHTAPIHLEDEVKKQLDEDVKLGVIEKVADLSEADTLAHKMGSKNYHCNQEILKDWESN